MLDSMVAQKWAVFMGKKWQFLTAKNDTIAMLFYTHHFDSIVVHSLVGMGGSGNCRTVRSLIRNWEW